jgi:hypothetical protein
LAVALAECCVAGRIGAQVAVPDGLDPFAEAPGCGYVVSGPGEVVANLGLVIGRVGGDQLRLLAPAARSASGLAESGGARAVQLLLELAVSELARAHDGGLRKFV